MPPPPTTRGPKTALGLAAILPASLIVVGLLLAAVFLAFPGKPDDQPRRELEIPNAERRPAPEAQPAPTPHPTAPFATSPPPLGADDEIPATVTHRTTATAAATTTAAAAVTADQLTAHRDTPAEPTASASSVPEPPPFRLSEPPAGGQMWEMAGGTHRLRTPEFPTECASESGAANTSDNNTNATMMVTLCVMRVPMYVMIVNQAKVAVNLTAVASKVNALVQRNATHETRVVIQAVFVDNTGCGRKHRVRRPQAKHFESHAEMVGTHFDCAAWLDTAKSMKDQFGAEVLTPSVPLTFGPTQNFIQQDALERRGVPRYMWAHADAAVDGPEPLTRLATAAAAIRHPFCVLFSHYDIIAVFDAVSVTREVGDWDAHLWYHGDVDYYSRCRHAKLPWGEASGHDVHHVGKGSGTINAGGHVSEKLKKRFQTLGRMYTEYHQSRGASLEIAPFDLPPKNKNLVGAWVDYRDAVRIPSPTSELADVVSRHMGRWMFPYRFLVRRDGEEKDAGGGGVARVAVRLEYLPVDLEREDSPVRGDRALQELRASLVAATHADAADVYIAR